MASTILTPDDRLSFPDFTLLRASAGSGKTRALAHRYMQFLLSDKIKRNALTNILAITFSNNAAREMKDRILTWLKKIYAGDKEHLEVLAYLTGLDHEQLRERAELLIDRILDNYSDFQVRTIDSFTASIFRSSALEFGISPSTEILLQKNQLVDQAFEKFFRNVKPGSGEWDILEKVIDYILKHKSSDTRYPWDPTGEIITVFKKLYGRLAALPGDIQPEDFSSEIAATFDAIKVQIKKINSFISDSGLEYNRTARFDRAIEAANNDDIGYALGKRHNSNLIKKGKMKREEFDDWNEKVNTLRDELNELYARLTRYYARSFYNPHIVNFQNFNAILSGAKRERNQIFIDDIGKLLTSYLHREIVPYVYLMLGDTIHHYLIDEFQDTSPLQWADLHPLIENSLSEGGSLFAVGDTKQAIYKFRGADFKIMKQLEESRVFPSAPPQVKDLDTNYRSDEYILRFNERFFDAIREHEEYGAAARMSGLDHHKQKASDTKINKGYAECIVYDAEDRDEEPHPERRKIIDIIHDALQRGYGYRDIAVLTLRNNDVTRISSWLSEEDIRFVSFSNLDVRNRKITGEIISLLRFLHSPVNDLAFASFCLGDIFRISLERAAIDKEEFITFFNRARNDAGLRKHPLYKNIQTRFPELWRNRIEQLFNRVGHLSIYDLTQDIYKTFTLYDSFPDEEAALTKFIEAIKNFEASGTNSLRAFLDAVDTAESDTEWNIDTPEKINAVQLMTIHKAKGLGFPVVIIALYGDHRMQEDFYIDDSGDAPRLLYLRKDFTDVDSSLDNVYKAHRYASIADFLNGLYVACTRAEEEMYLIGIPPKNIGTSSIFSLFPPSPSGEKVHRTRPPLREEKHIPVYHHNTPAHFDFGDTIPLNIDELHRGERIHEILASVEFIDDNLDQQIKNGLKDSKLLSDAAAGEIIHTVKRFLDSTEIRNYFEQSGNRIIKNETDVTDASGRLFRIDRLVIDRDEVTAIDYKTGDDKKHAADHASQVRNYTKILGEIYPGRTIRGIIAYIDTNTIQVIE